MLNRVLRLRSQAGRRLRSWHQFKARGSSLRSQGCNDLWLQEAFPTPVPLAAALPSLRLLVPAAGCTHLGGRVWSRLCFTLWAAPGNLCRKKEGWDPEPPRDCVL